MSKSLPQKSLLSENREPEKQAFLVIKPAYE